MMPNEQYFGGVLRLVVDSEPTPIFLVDDDMRILEYNTAAGELLDADASAVQHPRAGEALHCLHSKDVAEGCGHGPFCQSCVIRNSVKDGIHGNQVVRCQHKMELMRQGQLLEMDALITALPFPYQEPYLVLLAIESASDIEDNKSRLPISGWSQLLSPPSATGQ